MEPCGHYPMKNGNINRVHEVYTYTHRSKDKFDNVIIHEQKLKQSILPEYKVIASLRHIGLRCLSSYISDEGSGFCMIVVDDTKSQPRLHCWITEISFLALADALLLNVPTNIYFNQHSSLKTK